MKLCAIYNVWDDYEWLFESSKRIAPIVDGIILVHGTMSNFGEFCTLMQHQLTKWRFNGDTFNFEPDLKKDPRTNETDKRQYGLDKAREIGYTHFIMMDADEFYDPEEFKWAKQILIDRPETAGLVCRVKCYFRSPTLTIGYDTTLVPFIHKITPNLKFDFNRNYPFAWTDKDGVPFTEKKRIRIDPTRSMNINSGVEWADITMHHYSWVRSDIKKKIRNSTARQNLERSTIVQDYLNAKPGYFCQFYGKTLEEAPNVFGLPELTDTNVTGIQQANT